MTDFYPILSTFAACTIIIVIYAIVWSGVYKLYVEKFVKKAITPIPKNRLLDKVTMDEYFGFIYSRIKMAVQLCYLNNPIADKDEIREIHFHALVLAKTLEILGNKLISEHESMFGEGTLNPYIMDILHLWSYNGSIDAVISELKIK